MKRRLDNKLRLQFYGWILFIVCALLFIAESVIKRELLLLSASLLFFLGCLCFIIPLIESMQSLKASKDEEE